MSDFDPENTERELSRLRPAKPPHELIQRLSAALTSAPRQRVSRAPFQSHSPWWGGLPWAITTAAIFVLIVLLFYAPRRTPMRDQVHLEVKPTNKPATPSLKADDVEINQQLVTSFDAIAQLPDGEPVRLRCREWLDAVVLRDSARGVVIERHAPRLEVTPVRFETY